ncbi:MAG: UDP-galactopyranose mutase [Thermoanaerobaculia bacterium]
MSSPIRPTHDLLVVGAGPSGCVIAERAAEELGLSVLVIDRRQHIAGNCFDRVDGNGLLRHEYGPHYFRTDDAPLVAYLSRFTGWIPGNYRVKCLVRGELYPFPINLTTLEKFFHRELTETSARALLQRLAEKIPHPANSEEFVLSRIGRELYEAFYLGYTEKQWGRPPRELDASVCGRIPVRFDRDDRYADAPIQQMPAAGYTAMFRAMLDHPRIEIRLGVDYRELRQAVVPRLATAYCGPLDEYFENRLGPLPWRSLRFEHRALDVEYAQPCVQINYPGDEPFTRTVEIKHVTAQRAPTTVVTYEYPAADGEPFYPVPAPESAARFALYRELAEREERERQVYFTGRLASYRYINTDQAMLQALSTFDRMRGVLTAAPVRVQASR